MIREFWTSADKMLEEAAADGCKWSQLNIWIYWRIYEKIFEKQTKILNRQEKMLFAAAAAKSAREAIKAQKEVMAELRDILTKEIWAIDPDFCESDIDAPWVAPWTEPWKWKNTTVEKIADILQEYCLVELEGDIKDEVQD